ncbi:MAG: ribonuclease P protein component [Corallococcus sp.]|nr:ribonuclease P protein component [Bacillota bacterium]MCM1533196.1 ribonuclease P protein component [Corallococcus sp.]
MKSIYRLKKNYQYNYVYKHAQSVADRNLVLLYCKSNNKQSKVGFSVNKKFGNAVRRNRIRRQMKAAVSQFMPDVSIGYNMIFIPRKNEDYLFSDIIQSVNALLTRSGLLK